MPHLLLPRRLLFHCLLAALFLQSMVVDVARGDRMDMHSFESPYTHVDPSGTKSVSKDWKTGGVTTVNTNFVRLTPDRQVSR
jgi:hypothetical protein